jgi:putative peptidoglycan lipid II flippase
LIKEDGGSLVKGFLMIDGRERRIASAAGVIGSATLLSRLLGFIRDLIIAKVFGAGTASDAFFAAFRLPNMLRELLGEGALSAAFIPVFSESVVKRGREAARRLFRSVLTIVAVVLVVIAAAGVLLAPLLIHLIAPGFQAIPSKTGLAILLARVMFPYIVFVGLAALLMAVLNAEGHFGTPALSPTMLNLAMIGCALYLAPATDPPILALAVGVLLGGLGQVLIQVPAASRLGMGLRGGVDVRDPDVRRIARLMAPGVAGLGITQVNVFVGTFLASFLGEGSISVLYYAFRLIQLPIGLFGVAIATAAFPVMARQATGRSLGELAATVGNSVRLALFVTLPCMVGLLVFRVQIVQLLFERGAFDRTLTLATADAVLFYALGLGAYVTNRIVTPAFYSLQDTVTPVRVGAVAVLVNIGASLAFMGPLGASGLALATAMSSFANLGLLLFLFRRRLGPLRLGPSRPRRVLLRLASAAIVMGLAGSALLHWRDPVEIESVAARVLVLGAQLAASLGVYAAAACVGSAELTALLRRSGSRLGAAGEKFD